MKLRNPFTARRDAQIADLKRRLAEAEARSEESEGERRVLAARLTVEANANIRLDGRIKALTGQGKTRTASDVLEEHDVHRKALADALGDQKRHLNWGQLVDEVARLHKSAVAWMEDTASVVRRLDAERQRAERLQARLDDACGLSSPALDWSPDKSQRAKEEAS